MSHSDIVTSLFQKFVVPGEHGRSDYFLLIRALVEKRNNHPPTSREYRTYQEALTRAYALVEDELLTNQGVPATPVRFGTSGWRGLIGKDLFVRSIAQVTLAIVSLYHDLVSSDELAAALGVGSLDEARSRGAVIGYDNRFGGALLAGKVADVLTTHGFVVHYAGEATTGTLSAAVLELGAAFSVNLTPSHNPLEYGGFKFNAADAGPAHAAITRRISERTKTIMAEDRPLAIHPDPSLIREVDTLELWRKRVRLGAQQHALDYDRIMAAFAETDTLAVAVDCVHGASRIHVKSLFKDIDSDRLILIRADQDPTFGGIPPEPSSANMKLVTQALQARPEPLKLGLIMDPDADRVRFTDGIQEISMNQFGAMAYHYLHEIKKKKGMVAKTVATSNFANALAKAFHEKVFEPPVGFKEFKPVVDKALVCFEESDGITVIGHTPEKDAYIGLLLALDMTLTLRKNLSEYLTELQAKYGTYYPARGAVTVSQSGNKLKTTLALLEKYKPGTELAVGSETKRIAEVIAVDGRKMIFEDGSWLMIRPSGTEPKVRFYLEARTEEDKDALLASAKNTLVEIGLLQ